MSDDKSGCSKWLRFGGVDPSINHTGWSVISISRDILDADADYMPTTRDIKLEVHGTMIPKYEWRKKGGDKSGLKRYAWMAREWLKTLNWFEAVGLGLDYCMVEQPHYEGESQRATELLRGKNKRKGINKLIMTAGILTGIAISRGVPTYLATTWQWKRDTTDTALEGRIADYFPHTLVGCWDTTDEVMATGIALWGWRNHGRLTFE